MKHSRRARKATRFGRKDGLTLVEVILAVGILAFVLLTLAALQGSSLRVTAETAATREAVRLAENEIERQRITLDATGCATTMPTGYSCEITVVYCATSGATITCSSATDESSATSSAVRVTITDATARELTLTRWIP